MRQGGENLLLNSRKRKLIYSDGRSAVAWDQEGTVKEEQITSEHKKLLFHYLDRHDGFTNVYIYICVNSSNLHALSICSLKYNYISVKLLKRFFKVGESTLQIFQSL